MVLVNLYGFLVQGLFQTVALTTTFMILSIWLYNVWAKMGPLLTSVLSILYAMSILMAYYGGIIGGLMFVAALLYFIAAVLPWIGSMWER